MTHRLLSALLTIGLVLVAASGASAERLGLHVTGKELEIWRQRAKTGPYRTPGDVRKNSPGDWQRILAHATAFRANPARERYTGGNVTYNGACVINTKDTSGPSRTQGAMLRDAAFAYLITRDRGYRDAVRGELLAQIAEPGVDFTNRTKWNHNRGCLTGVVDPTFELGNWANRVMFAYDYIRPTLPEDERQRIERWLLNTALFFDWWNQTGPATRFPTRHQYRDPAAYPASPSPPGRCTNVSLYHGGPCRYQWHEMWNNLQLLTVRFTGQAGILLGHEGLQDHAKRFVKEWFAYAIYPDGSEGELDRWTDSHPEKGLGYWGGALAHAIVLADAFCRAGDCELFEYTTSAGMHGTAGGQKGLRQVITRYLNYRDHTVKRYATRVEAARTRATLIDGVDGAWQSINDVSNITLANLYYRNEYFRSHYLRTRPGLPDYPENPAAGLGWWGGADNQFPGILFMWGQMEGRVWPYPKAPPAPIDDPPPRPSSLHVPTMKP